METMVVSGHVMEMMVASRHGIRTGNKDDGPVTTQRQDT
jgi:hypothetical protein